MIEFSYRAFLLCVGIGIGFIWCTVDQHYTRSHECAYGYTLDAETPMWYNCYRKGAR